MRGGGREISLFFLGIDDKKTLMYKLFSTTMRTECISLKHRTREREKSLGFEREGKRIEPRV